MSKGFDLLDYDMNKVLFVFALESEAGAFFKDKNVVFTGVGKVNASYHVTKAIAKFNPELIVNLGTAGSGYFKRYEVVNCTEFVQRDMDVCGLGFEMYETPYSKTPIVLQHGLIFNGVNRGICGTGDSFETNLTDKIYNLVDMEAYALASIAHAENIDFLCLKFISDGADDEAATSWTENVRQAPEAFYNLLF
nr:nucleosidase [uncultured Flavobacterium sp.]